MRQVNDAEAKASLEALLDLVQQGEQVVITRAGQPVARLVRELPAADRARAAAAAARIRALAKEADLGPFDWTEWKAYRDEGRADGRRHCRPRLLASASIQPT